jgi:hypothetical protein
MHTAVTMGSKENNMKTGTVKYTNPNTTQNVPHDEHHFHMQNAIILTM